MQIEIDRETDEVIRYQTYGFKRGVGFEPSSMDYDQTMEMSLDFGDEDDGTEDLDEDDLHTENTWPSRREARRG
jgi:hypothetical protein